MTRLHKNPTFLITILLVADSRAQLLVNLPNGPIKGHEVQSFTGKSYHAFEGVPFAKPPLGKLRFQDTQSGGKMIIQQLVHLYLRSSQRTELNILSYLIARLNVRDSSKAFDRVSHCLLISRCLSAGVSDNLQKWITDYLLDRMHIMSAPESPDNWNEVLETTELKYCCFSVTRDFDSENEDCLYLNVFTPILDRAKNLTKLPVVFWFYGGGFINGCAGWYPQYWMDEDIVVVIPNYRVGPFGFLATGDLAAPGNAGLKDQALALKWAYENVHLFGGDNQRITIAGQSAGGSSVGWQLLNPKTKGMFRAAIIESGSPMNTWAYRDNAYDYAVNLAKTINGSIPDLTTMELVDFLQGVDAKTIDVSSTITPVKQPLPVIEPLHADAFITEAMYELFDSGNYTQVPTIIGVNSEEKITLASDYEKLIKYATAADENLESLVPGNFNYKPTASPQEVGERIRFAYTGNEKLEENLGKYIRLSSDNQYTRSVIKQGKLMAKYNDVYFYIFSYDGVAGGVNLTFPDADSVAHAEELKYNWSTEPLSDMDEADRTTHYRMMKLWTNFVKYLNPTPAEDELLQNITWKKVSKEAFNFLNINASLSLEVNPKSDFFVSWERIFDDYAQRPYKTY